MCFYSYLIFRFKRIIHSLYCFVYNGSTMVENVSESEKKPFPRYSRKSMHLDGQCGCGPKWSPVCLQWLRWPWLILAYTWAISIVIYMNGSYFGATLSTIERRFGLSSVHSAFIATATDLSSTVTIVVIAFLADRTSRPLWLTFALMLLATGNLMTALPHFLSNSLDPNALLEGRLTTIAASKLVVFSNTHSSISNFPSLNPRLTEGGSYHPLEIFSLSPQNQKEIDLRHLGNLNYILCGHFDEK